MRYKIEKIAKRNNLKYEVVEYFPAYENIYNEIAWI